MNAQEEALEELQWVLANKSNKMKAVVRDEPRWTAAEHLMHEFHADKNKRKFILLGAESLASCYVDD